MESYYYEKREKVLLVSTKMLIAYRLATNRYIVLNRGRLEPVTEGEDYKKLAVDYSSNLIEDKMLNFFTKKMAQFCVYK